MGAEERQYTKAQAAVIICRYIAEHMHDPEFSFTIYDIMALTGRSRVRTWYDLLELDEVLCTYIEREQRRGRGGRWGTVRRRVLRG